jgi:ribonuclease P protein component
VASFTGPDGPPRVGLLVSKSCGTAVTRNRIKRRLRSAADSVELQPRTDYVIIATDQVARVPHRQIVDWLARALEESANA